MKTNILTTIGSEAGSVNPIFKLLFGLSCLAFSLARRQSIEQPPNRALTEPQEAA